MDKTTTRWFDEMATELRLRQVRGQAVGEAVAEVEAHCQETGEAPQDVFGDPREYARSLCFAADEVIERGARQWAVLLAPLLLGGLGFLLAGPTARAAARGVPVELAWGELGALAAMVVFVAVVVRWTRAMLQQRLTGMLAFMGVVTVAAMLPILMPGIALRIPLAAAAVGTVALLVLSVVGMYRRGDEFADPLVDPRGVAGPVDRHPRADRWMLGLLPWLLPIAAGVSALLEWWTA